MLSTLFILTSYLFAVGAVCDKKNSNLQGTNAFLANFADAGIDGFFQMTFDSGSANYDFKFDLTGFETTCDLSQGLTYHVHSFWTDETGRASTTTCGDAGGHYDPYLACGPSSQDGSALCPMLNRTADQGYTYACSSTEYAAGHHAECEVGDFSGKFGRMMPSIASPTTFIGLHVDPNPPMMANYGTTDSVSNQWASLVVHCPADNARLMCAQFYREQC